MTVSRRRLLAGAAVAATAGAGCLDGTTGTGTGGGTPTAVPEEPRVDEPPYEIERPPADSDDWDDLYLCANAASGTGLAFQEVPAPPADLLLSTHDHHEGDAYAVRALTRADEVRAVFDREGGTDSPDEPLDEIDFERYLLLVVEDGYGSGSVTHHWQRAASTEHGLHLHGCHRRPFERTDDITSRHSVLKVERPERLELARVSLTVARDRRVHFNSTEGVVTVDRDR